MSQYYPDSPEITKEDISRVHELTSAEFPPENTRLAKQIARDNDGTVINTVFLLHVASGDGPIADGDVTADPKIFMYDNSAILAVGGDHGHEMTQITAECEAASATALNETEKAMFKQYAKSFKSGSMAAHKESQKLWVTDKGPKVECNIGFIETYRDPQGLRGEWEGFVAMVNEEQTKKFGELVENAGSFIPRLPWGKDFEKDEFSKPDFTSLEVLSFCTSGIPAGINIPNCRRSKSPCFYRLLILYRRRYPPELWLQERLPGQCALGKGTKRAYHLRQARRR